MAATAPEGATLVLGEDELRKVVEEFIKGKELESLRFSDVRAYVEQKTRSAPSKDLLKDIIRSVLESQTAGKEQEQAASESESPNGSDAEEEPPAVRAKAGGGFKTPCFLSQALQAVVGVEEASRAEVTKKLWEYIKKHNLQDPAKKSEILCDSKLRALLKRDRVNGFKMNKLLSPHIKSKKDVGVKVEADDEDDDGEEEEEEEDDVDDDDDDDDAPKNRKALKRKSSASSASASKKVKLDSKSGSARGGFGKDMLLVSPLLQEFLKSESSTRPQAVKAIWDHIKEHGLQNPSNKREIMCDAALETLFRRKVVTMFNLNMFLTVHLKKSSEQGASAGPGWDYSKLDMDDAAWKAAKEEAGGPAKSKSKSKPAKKGAKTGKGKGGGLNMPVQLSEQLGKFMRRATASRGEVVKALWVHIKEHGLQNPSNKTEIICDAVLTELLGQARVTMFGLNKPLQRHYIRAGASSAAASSDEDAGDE